MSDKQIGIPFDCNLQDFKEFLLETLTGNPTSAHAGRLFYNSALKRGVIGVHPASGNTLVFAVIPRVDVAQDVTGLWNFAPASGAPFQVGSNTLVNNLNAAFLRGKYPATDAESDRIVLRLTGGHILGQPPVEPTHLATKFYVDQMTHNVVEKPPNRLAAIAALPGTYQAAASTSPVIPAHSLVGTTNGALPAIDGVTNVAVGDRILVLNQGGSGTVNILSSNHKDNGQYIVTSLGSASSKWILTRIPELDSSVEISGGASTFVAQGTTLAGTQWSLLSHGSLTINSSPLQFTRTSGAYTSHTHPASEITSGRFADNASYDFMRSLSIGVADGDGSSTDGQGVWFGEKGNSGRPRVVKFTGRQTLLLTGTQGNNQAVVTIATINNADPVLEALNQTTSRGKVSFLAPSIRFDKPITVANIDSNNDNPAWGSLYTTDPPTTGSTARKDLNFRSKAGTSSRDHKVALKFSATLAGNGTSGSQSSPFNVDHNLGTRDVIVQVRKASNYKEIIVEAIPSSPDRVQVRFGTPPADGNNHIVTVIG